MMAAVLVLGSHREVIEGSSSCINGCIEKPMNWQARSARPNLKPSDVGEEVTVRFGTLLTVAATGWRGRSMPNAIAGTWNWHVVAVHMDSITRYTHHRTCY